MIWLAIVVFSRAVGPAVGHRPGRVLLLVPVAGRPYARLGLDRPDRLRLFAGVPAARSRRSRALPWQAFMAVWTAILLAARVRCSPAAVFAVGVVLSADGAGRRQHPPAPGGGDRARASAGRRPGRSCCSRRSRPGIGLLWFVVRGEWRQLAIALGATAADRGRVVRDRCRMPGSNGSRCCRGSPGATARGPPCRSRSGPAAVRGRARRLGRPDEPPLDGARGRRCWPCRRCGTAASRCCWRSSRCVSRPTGGPAGSGRRRQEPA